MLGDHLESNKCKVHHAPGDTDTDLLIVQKAVESATMINTLLVGDDTDCSFCSAIMQASTFTYFSFNQCPRRPPRNLE